MEHENTLVKSWSTETARVYSPNSVNVTAAPYQFDQIGIGSKIFIKIMMEPEK